MANGNFVRVPSGISVPTPGSITTGAVFRSPNIGNLFNRESQGGNVLDTINQMFQMRRKNQREAMEDKLAEKKSSNEAAKLDLENRDLERKLNQPSILDQLKGLQGDGGFSPGTSASFKEPATGMTITTPLNREFTVPESKAIEQANIIVSSLDELEEGLGTSAEFLAGAPFGLFNKGAQNFKLVRKSVADELIRLKSGAQINEEEFKRLMDLLPTFTNLKEVDKKQLNRFKKQFSGVRDRILRGESAPKTDIKTTAGEKVKSNFSQKEQDLLDTFNSLG